MEFKSNFTVISGGQTGIDQLGLEIAKKYGIPTGGFIAPGFMTENGERPQLGEKYGLCEMSEGGSIKRTKANVENSDATVVFGDIESPGSNLTLKHAIKKGKATLINPNAVTLLKFLSEHQVMVLNIAGNRLSGLTQEHYELAKQTLEEVFSTLTQSSNHNQ